MIIITEPKITGDESNEKPDSRGVRTVKKKWDDAVKQSNAATEKLKQVVRQSIAVMNSQPGSQAGSKTGSKAIAKIQVENLHQNM